MQFMNTNIKIIRRFIVEIIRLFKWIRCLYLYLFMRKKVILVRAAVITKIGGVKHFNWGDDINYYFLNLISGKKIVFLPHGKISELMPIPSYLGIGSIISFFSLKKVTIIGSGILNDTEIEKIKDKPYRICFVRGPLTRNALLKKGIDCPESYGDLALALPLYYKTSVTKNATIGIVLHLLDEGLNSVQYIKSTYPEIKIIHMNNYNKWTDVIDEINSCEIVLSSALHGIIVSEAYKVCCQWISFDDKNPQHWHSGYEFKYIDFYTSIGKSENKPLEIGINTDIYALVEKIKKSWEPSTFDASKLIKILPKEFFSNSN